MTIYDGYTNGLQEAFPQAPIVNSRNFPTAGASKPFAFNAFIGTASQGGSGTQGYSLLTANDPARLAAVSAAMIQGVAGISYSFDWKTLEPTQGAYNWAPVLLALGDMALYPGAQTMLRITGGDKAPPYVLASVSTVVDSSGKTVPVPWDTTFLTRLKALITAFGLAFNGNPLVYQVYVTAGGKVGEMSLDTGVTTGTYQSIWSSVAGNNSLAFQTPAGGYTDTKYSTGAVGTSVWPTVMDAYHSAFPNTQLTVTLDEPFGSSFTNPDTSAGTACVPAVTALGDTGGPYAGAFGWQQNGLDETDIGKQPSGRFRRQLRRNRLGAGGPGCGYQFVKAEGDLRGLADGVIVCQQDGAGWVEVYTADIKQFPQVVAMLTSLPPLRATATKASQFELVPDQSSPLTAKSLSFRMFAPTNGSPATVSATVQAVSIGSFRGAAGGLVTFYLSFATQVAAGSNGVNVNTFTGTQTLQVGASAGAPASGFIEVATSTGAALLSYNGTTGGFQNCLLLAGSGTVATNNVVSVQEGATHALAIDQTVMAASLSTTQLNGVELLIIQATETQVQAIPTGTPGLTNVTFATEGSGTVSFSHHLYDMYPDSFGFWVQTAAGPTTSPTFIQAGPQLATALANPSAPGASSSQTLVMAGFAIPFTPKVSGNVAVVIAGVGQTATAVTGFNVAGRYGTGTAPIAGAAVTGTAFPQGTLGVRPAVVSANTAWTLVGALTGLVVGTTYWFDVAYSTNTAADAVTIANISAVIMERQ